ncbi:MAG TPA: DUF2242 domain-containing protein [Luteimonas sp.]|nr:DUF2242 domain-containing protein [Luteimonas sp.]
MTSFRAGACLLLVPLVLVACGGAVRTDPMLAAESFNRDATYSRRYTVAPAQACEAARRALLGQGYAVTSSAANLVVASKNFQSGDDQHSQIEIRTSCVDAGDGGTLLFASALQDRYALKKSATSASLGVGALGSLSLPVGSSDDSLVRVASRTVQDAEFYQRFFERVGYYLPEPVAQPAPPPGDSPEH